MTPALIEAHDLHLQFDQRTVLNNVSLAIRPAEIVTVIGPNGAGKTSLVKIILGLQKATAGTLVRAKGLRIGYMPQKLHIDRSLPLSVHRFMQLALRDDQAIASCLALTGISHLDRAPVHALSGGETQRLLLARALLRSPNLLVLDEPVQGVDVAGQSRLYQLIADIRQQHQCAVLMVSHDLHLVMEATDTVICLNQHVCCHGHPETVSEHPAFLELFGHVAPTGIAVYTHHHDHSHNIHGEVSARQSGASACEEHSHA